MSPEDTRLSPHTSCAPESGTQAPSAQGFSRGCRHGVCQGQGHPRAQRGQNRLPSVSTTVARTRPHRLVARGPQPACRSPSPPEQAQGWARRERGSVFCDLPSEPTCNASSVRSKFTGTASAAGAAGRGRREGSLGAFQSPPPTLPRARSAPRPFASSDSPSDFCGSLRWQCSVADKDKAPARDCLNSNPASSPPTRPPLARE